MLRVILFRAILMAVPFVIWFAWSAWAKRNGREMGATPWSWLVAAGAVLVGLSLAVTALVHPDNRDDVYVPGEVQADGSISAGRFEAPK